MARECLAHSPAMQATAASQLGKSSLPSQQLIVSIVEFEPKKVFKQWKIIYSLHEYYLASYLCTLALPPLAKASTSANLAMVVSPGKVVSNAPCAQPSRNDSSGSRPVIKP